MQEHYRQWGIWITAQGYPVIKCAGKETRLHCFVWEEVNGPIPKGYEIHHKDFNKLNWNLENLELLTRMDHRRIHEGWVKTDGVWSHKMCYACNRLLPLSEFGLRRKATVYRAECRKCGSALALKWWKDNKQKSRQEEPSDRAVAGKPELRPL